VKPHNKKELQSIRQVNRAFCLSATRLLYQSVGFTLQRSRPRIPLEFGKFSQGERAHFVQKVCIRDSSILPDEPYKPADLCSRTHEIATELARFPALKKVSLQFREGIFPEDNQDPDTSRALAASICEGLPKDLQALSLHRLEPSLVHIVSQPTDSSPCILSSLQSFTFKSAHLEPRDVSGDEVLLALQNAPDLKELSLSSIGRLSYDAILQFTAGRNIPHLRRLKLDRIIIPAPGLSRFLHVFRHTLQDLCLHNVWLERRRIPGLIHIYTSTTISFTYYSWGSIFDLLRSSFHNLTTLRFAQCEIPPRPQSRGQQTAIGLPPLDKHFRRQRTADAYFRCIVRVEENRERLGRPAPEWERVEVWHPCFNSPPTSPTDDEHIAEIGDRPTARGRGRRGKTAPWALYTTFRRYSIGLRDENGKRAFAPKIYRVFSCGCTLERGDT
jgi:hypothetical protein